MIQANTFSIAARCPRTGLLGVAVSTAVPAVGGIVPYIRPGLGAIATQAWVNPHLGVDGLTLLAQGLSARACLERLIADDPGRTVRQIGVVDRDGAVAAYTGSDCTDWAGHRVGRQFTVQGNMLVGAATIDAMAEAAAASEAEPLHERLMLALEAGQKAGGDKRGKQSAALKIYKSEAYPWLDLRVDEHRAPVAELRRVLEIAKLQLLPFVEGMPTRDNPLGALPDQVRDMLMTPPPDRPGGSGGA